MHLQERWHQHLPRFKQLKLLEWARSLLFEQLACSAGFCARRVPSLTNLVATLFVFSRVVGWLFRVRGCAFLFAKILMSAFGYTYSEQINDPLPCLPSIKRLIKRSIERLVEGVIVWVVARVSRHVFPQPVGMVWVAAVLMSWGVVLVLHWVVDVTCVVAVFWHTRWKMTTMLFHYTMLTENCQCEMFIKVNKSKLPGTK